MIANEFEFKFTFDDNGIKQNIFHIENLVHVTTQAQYANLKFNDIITILDITKRLVENSNIYGLIDFVFEKIGSKLFHQKINYINGLSEFNCNEESLLTNPPIILSPAQHIQERISRFEIIKELVILMNTLPLIKIEFTRL